MRFEWDERKNKENLRKHGFDLADAWEVFESPLFVRLDEREDYGEDRWIALGTLRGRIVVVTFTERAEGEVTRIISLRKALKHEREDYKKSIAH